MNDKYLISALRWIDRNTVDSKGISVTSKNHNIYPEVTGYYIPTLLQWGKVDLAMSYAKHLCEIQTENGGWLDPDGRMPYVFDSAQILKGLLAIRNRLPRVDAHIIKGCEWILLNMQEDGRLKTPDTEAWGDEENFCSELVHVYCLRPIKDAGKVFAEKRYIQASQKILEYYKKNYKYKIMHLSLLSHFYAYVMEGLVDMGDTELAREAMYNIYEYETRDGGIKGLNNVNWVCSTGMFQIALVWYKLGEAEKGNKIFDYACKLQNDSGGWYGSYRSETLIGKLSFSKKYRPYYFSDQEISWANKYFLDALYWKRKVEKGRG